MDLMYLIFVVIASAMFSKSFIDLKTVLGMIQSGNYVDIKNRLTTLSAIFIVYMVVCVVILVVASVKISM